jgi:hypothetical protein
MEHQFNSRPSGVLLAIEKWKMSKKLMESEMRERQERMNLAKWQAEEEARARAFQMNQPSEGDKARSHATDMAQWEAGQQDSRGRAMMAPLMAQTPQSVAYSGGAPMVSAAFGAMGPEMMHEGMMQSGRLAANLAGQSMGQKQPKKNQTEMLDQLYAKYGIDPMQAMKAVGGPGKTGGTVPKDGVYKLHEGEKVIPTPETYKDVLMKAMTDQPLKEYKGPKKPLDSYEYGTDEIDQPGFFEDLMEQMSGIGALADPLSRAGEQFYSYGGTTGEKEAYAEEQAAEEPFEPSQPLDMGIEGMEFEDPYGQGGPPMPHSYSGSKAASQGAPEYRVDESPISEKGKEMRPDQETVKKYTMEGDPLTPDEHFDQEGKRRQQEIDSYSQRAMGLEDTAANLEMYAAERPNSPSSQNLMMMAKEKRDQAKQMMAVAQTKQQRKDAWEGKAAEEMARVTAAEIEKETEQIRTRGRVAGEQIKAGGQAGSKAAEQQIETFFKAIEALRNLGMEDEAYGLLQQLMPALMQPGTQMGG